MKILFVFIVVFSFSTINAQWLRSFGVDAGLTISHQDWDFSSTLNYNPKDKVGFSFGIFAEFQGTSNFSLVTQINYIQKGVEDEVHTAAFENNNLTITKHNWQRDLNYLNFTILAKGRYGLGSFVPYIIFGPKLDLEISNIEYIDGEKVEYGEKIPQMVDDYEKALFGIKTGVGSEFELFSVLFFVEFVYDLDFTPLYSSEYLEIKTMCYNFNLGVSF